ncbi:NAD-dependent epimerase/dehydratase family protein [Arthrobacter cryoconiti]|uniref:NAD-dependent epimerase/dehydratase family protein n=1 Tax=Arthrobacter cryoconiti TaxID=748907 RepID=A0ABV8QVS0_9MICC|nr:NAD-dependent epimerase/dehydratase family protein [Arthrobacter cryoconiti]MCC9068938.1 NAD-dependent epimerase/dehydratase family protein [Arthrobacter cryoconiti]
MNTPAPQWVILGGTGFVGSSVMAELRARSLPAFSLQAPRLTTAAQTANAIAAIAVGAADATGAIAVGAKVADAADAGAVAGANAAADVIAAFVQLKDAFAGAAVVVNAAGLATPGERASGAMMGANALLPGLAALAARAAGVPVFIHLSSASVQGHRPIIDETADRAPFSAYSRSKAIGEEVLETVRAQNPSPAGDAGRITTVRATSVQGPSRPTTQQLVRIARSRISSVAAPGTAPTPVSSINALSWFVTEVALYEGPIPAIVLQPWEGLGVAQVLTAAGGRSPLQLPAWLAHTVLACGYAVSKVAREKLHGPLRRVELMWFGQSQRPGWAQEAGVLPHSAVREVLQAAQSVSGS